VVIEAPGAAPEVAHGPVPFFVAVILNFAAAYFRTILAKIEFLKGDIVHSKCLLSLYTVPARLAFFQFVLAAPEHLTAVHALREVPHDLTWIAVSEHYFAVSIAVSCTHSCLATIALFFLALFGTS